MKKIAPDWIKIITSCDHKQIDECFAVGFVAQELEGIPGVSNGNPPDCTSVGKNSCFTLDNQLV